jgi:hypothetical protein
MHWFEKKGTARIWCPHGRGNAGRLRKVISEDSKYRAVVPAVTMVSQTLKETIEEYTNGPTRKERLALAAAI